MTQRGRRRGWGPQLLVGILGVLAACGSPGGDGCGGIEDLVSCVDVVSIQPSANGTETSNVDAFQNPDCNGDQVFDDPEPFTDHNADFTFANSTFPGATDSQAVSLRSVTITYSINNCPVGATCPPLSEVSQGVALAIPKDSQASATFPLVLLQTKAEYVRLGGSQGPPPSYNAHYTFTAQTENFADTFTVEANVGFTIGNFDLCQ